MSRSPTPLFGSPRIEMIDSCRNFEQVLNYEQRRYKGLDQQLVNYRESRIIADFLQQAPTENGRVLDVPSGYGRFTPLLLASGLGVVAADIDVNMLLRITQRPERTLAMVCADMLQLPFRNNAFQGLLCMRLLQHIHAPQKRMAAFAEIARVVSHWAIVSVYTSTAIHKLMRKLGHFKKITMERQEYVIAQFQRSGFRVVRARKILDGLHAQTIFLLQLRTTPVEDATTTVNAELPQQPIP